VNRALKDALAEGRTAAGLWVTLESPALTEIAAELGLDWVAIDLEHGHLGAADVAAHLRAARGSATSVLVRVEAGTEENIKTALDLGADGVIVPLIRSVAEVERAVRYAHYPPQGGRTLGAERAVRWGLRAAEYLASANDDVLVVPIFETLESVEAMEEILDLPGVGAVFVGPGDLSACQGHVGQWEGPGVAEQVEAILAAADRRGIAAGILAQSAEDAAARRDQGFRMLALGSDTLLLIGAIERMREALAR
jgi:2-keto-3-deoxy-L-rhamnonate aldolase RhmA